MSLLALELSDAGMRVAGGDPPRLLEVDGSETESPGYALAKKAQLLVGKTAEHEAHLYPNLIQHRFWDQLNRDPLKKAVGPAQNYAEIAYAHMKMIWERVRFYGSEMIIIVPGFMNREQLGLLLGITQELSIPVKGLVTHAAAAPSHPLPDARLFYLDIHLHRTELTFLDQTSGLCQGEPILLDEAGLMGLNRLWVDALAEEFVRNTRFDPLHKAATEQELYDRIPGMMRHLEDNASMSCEMRSRHTVHHVTVTRDLFVKRTEPFLNRLRDLILSTLEDKGGRAAPLALMLSARFSHLPGVAEFTQSLSACRSIPLESGACALNLIRQQEQYEIPTHASGVSLITSRSWEVSSQYRSEWDEQTKNLIQDGRPKGNLIPTHFLYDNRAYPITKSSFWVGRDLPHSSKFLQIKSQGVSTKHCSIQRIGTQVLVTDTSEKGTYLDGKRMEDPTPVALGQTIQLGDSGETIRFIALVNPDEI